MKDTAAPNCFNSHGTIYVMADRASEKTGRRIASRLMETYACTCGKLDIIYDPDDLSADGAIILLGGEKSAVRCPDGMPIAVSSSNRSALRELGARHRHAIICGMYTRDTVTLSSYDGDCALVALQRTVLSLNGEEIDPREIKIRLKDSLPSPDIPLITAGLLLNNCCGENEVEL